MSYRVVPSFKDGGAPPRFFEALFGLSRNGQAVAISSILIGSLIAMFLADVLNVGWNFDGAAPVLLWGPIFWVAGALVASSRKYPAVATMLQIMGAALMMMMVGAALALLATRSPAALADNWLAAADSLLPLTAMDVVRAVATWPTWSIQLLHLVYEKTGLLLLLTVAALGLHGRGDHAWRMFAIWCVSLVAVSILSFTAPALGCFVHLSSEEVAGLPAGAGRYAMQAFTDFRSAADPVLSLNRAAGVITFPSFHTVCALLLSQAWHGVRWLGGATKILTAVIIFSCIPMGGHYIVDLAAGAVVWFVATKLVDRARVPSTREAPIQGGAAVLA